MTKNRKHILYYIYYIKLSGVISEFSPETEAIRQSAVRKASNMERK